METEKGIYSAHERLGTGSSVEVPKWLAISAGVITIVVIYGSLAPPKWFGVSWIGVSDKTFWDYLKLLVVPGALALGVYWLQLAQRERERIVEDRRAQDVVLQAYLDRLSELLLDKNLHEKDNQYDATRVTARAQTLSALRQLDGRRKAIILQFLREARLINREDNDRKGRRVFPSIVGLNNADLSNACLRGAKLINTDEDEPISLKGANLEGADLRDAELKGADLSGVNLYGARVSEVQLYSAWSLEGATMPNGKKYEDWIKDPSRREAWMMPTTA